VAAGHQSCREPGRGTSAVATHSLPPSHQPMSRTTLTRRVCVTSRLRDALSKLCTAHSRQASHSLLPFITEPSINSRQSRADLQQTSALVTFGPRHPDESPGETRRPGSSAHCVRKFHNTLGQGFRSRQRVYMTSLIFVETAL
jgi:hypothetical protein